MIAAALAVPLLAGCGTYAHTEPDSVAVHERGYHVFPTDKTLDDNCVPTAKTQRLGYGDKAYYYPAGERSWKFGEGQGVDRGPIEVPTSDNQVAKVYGTLKFFLNTDCGTLNAFHQRIGRKVWGPTQAYVNDGDYRGWAAMLGTVIDDPLESGFGAEVPAYPTLDLWKDKAKRDELEAAVEEILPAEIKRQSGGAFFRDFTLTVNRVVPPQGTIDALQREANAKSLKAAQVAENETAATRYEQITACVTEIKDLEACTFIYAVDSGKVAAVVPPGSAVSLR